MCVHVVVSISTVHGLVNHFALDDELCADACDRPSHTADINEYMKQIPANADARDPHS